MSTELVRGTPEWEAWKRADKAKALAKYVAKDRREKELAKVEVARKAVAQAQVDLQTAKAANDEASAARAEAAMAKHMNRLEVHGKQVGHAIDVLIEMTENNTDMPEEDKAAALASLHVDKKKQTTDHIPWAIREARRIVTQVEEQKQAEKENAAALEAANAAIDKSLKEKAAEIQAEKDRVKAEADAAAKAKADAAAAATKLAEEEAVAAKAKADEATARAEQEQKFADREAAIKQDLADAQTRKDEAEAAHDEAVKKEEQLTAALDKKKGGTKVNKNDLLAFGKKEAKNAVKVINDKDAEKKTTLKTSAEEEVTKTKAALEAAEAALVEAGEIHDSAMAALQTDRDTFNAECAAKDAEAKDAAEARKDALKKAAENNAAAEDAKAKADAAADEVALKEKNAADERAAAEAKLNAEKEELAAAAKAKAEEAAKAAKLEQVALEVESMKRAIKDSSYMQNITKPSESLEALKGLRNKSAEDAEAVLQAAEKDAKKAGEKAKLEKAKELVSGVDVFTDPYLAAALKPVVDLSKTPLPAAEAWGEDLSLASAQNNLDATCVLFNEAKSAPAKALKALNDTNEAYKKLDKKDYEGFATWFKDNMGFELKDLCHKTLEQFGLNLPELNDEAAPLAFLGAVESFAEHYINAMGASDAGVAAE